MPSSSATVPYALNLSSNLHTQIQVFLGTKSFYTEMITQSYLNLTYLTLFKRTHLHYTTSGIIGNHFVLVPWRHAYSWDVHACFNTRSLWFGSLMNLHYYFITILLYYLITVLPYYCITLFEHWDKCNYVWYVITTLNNYIQWINLDMNRCCLIKLGSWSI